MLKGQEVQVFPAIILLGLTVFGLAWVASEGMDFDLGGGEEIERDQVTFTSRSFGKVGSASQDFRTVNFGSFTVGEARGDVLVERRRKATVANSLFSDGSIWMEYNATQPRKGKIAFEVLGRRGPGEIFVEVNGKRVFEQHLVSSGTPEIEIPSGALKTGLNTIRIGANHGILSSTEYRIEELRVTVNDRKFHDYRDNFQVYGYEVQDFVSGELSFNVRDSVKKQPLEVYINGRKLYSKRQVRVSPEEISVNPGNADLKPGYNTIRFETDGESYYTLENARLQLRYLGNTERKTVRMEFSSTEQERSFAAREDTRETISFRYQRLIPSPESMSVQLNNNTYRLTPENGVNSIQIPADAIEENNELEIRSNTTYQLNNLQVLSEKEAN